MKTLKKAVLMLTVIALVAALASACGGGGGENNDSNNTGDTGSGDAGTEDSGTEDSGTEDSGTEDSGTEDSGTEDSGTDDSGTEDTGPEPCGEDERVEAGSCVACPAGTTNEAGDDPSGDDTQCDTVLCGENEQVTGNSCVACAGDLVSEAGADASGPDTQCYDDDDCFAVVGVDCTTAEQAYFKGDSSGNAAFFGFSVAMDDAGETLAVSAPFEGEPSSGNVRNPSTGRVYIFTKSSGSWSEQATVDPSPGDDGDRFGLSIAIEGDTLVVGAPRDDSDGTSPGNNDLTDSGAVFVFTRSGEEWSQSAFIKADNAGQGDEFGRSVDIDGGTIVVGAWHETSASGGVGADETDNSLATSGAVYIFDNSTGSWTQTAYIKQPFPGENDLFGKELALEGDILVVGMDREDSSATGIDGDLDNDDATDSGAAFIYSREAGTWSLQASLKASNAGEGDRFGYTVAVSGETVAVAAVDEESSAEGVGGAQDDNTSSTGAVYVFKRAGDTWTQQAYIKPFVNNTGFDTVYGQSLELTDDGSLLAVGAAFNPSGSTGLGGDPGATTVAEAGAVYLYERDDTGAWSEDAFVKSFNTHAQQRFGQDVAMSAEGKYLFVGAHWEDGASSGVNGDPTELGADRRGAAYLYQVAPW